MSPAQRVAAMWRGDLTLFQLTRWSSRSSTRDPAARRRVRLHRDADARMGRGGRQRLAQRHPPHRKAGRSCRCMTTSRSRGSWLAQSRDHAPAVQPVWLDQLRAGDPAFAEASLLYPADMGRVASRRKPAHRLRPGLGSRSAPRSSQSRVDRTRQSTSLTTGAVAWSSSEDCCCIRWAAHFWDVGLAEVKLPLRPSTTYNFRRWVTACHLYKRIPPALRATPARRTR